MRVPISAMWPPLLLLMLAIAAGGLFLVLGFWIMTALAIIGSMVLILDTIGRMKDFHHAARHLSLGRSPDRVAGTYQFSWCGRKACEAAARSVSRETGEAVSRYYREAGYRWYHVFPDNTFSRRSPFLTWRFWQFTLGGNMHAQAAIARDHEISVHETEQGESGIVTVTQRAA